MYSTQPCLYLVAWSSWFYAIPVETGISRVRLQRVALGKAKTPEISKYKNSTLKNCCFAKTKTSSSNRLIDVRRSQSMCVFVCVWLTQVRRQPGRLVLHSAGWPRGGSMDGGGSGVWQQVRGRTERAPLLLWIDTETQSMAHKALRPALNPNSPAFSPPRSLSHTQPTPPACLEPLIPAHARDRSGRAPACQLDKLGGWGWGGGVASLGWGSANKHPVALITFFIASPVPAEAESLK